jgi:hypothetical protein
MLQYNPSISGSLSVTGSLIVTNGVIGTVNGVDVQIFSSSISQVVTNIQTTTGSQSGRLTSIESFTSSTSARLGSIETISASNLSRINSIETITSSNIARLNNIEIVSASNIARINSLETTSASVNTLNTTQNTRLTNLENKTGSLATTGSNIFYGAQVFSGSLYVQNELIVQGSSSLQNITASAVSIGTNIVNLNTANPAVRYGGISVQDSGSASGVTGSMLWDSTCNRWVYANPSGVGYSGGIIMSGPRAATLGGEVTLTCNYVAKSGGGDHLYDSCIVDDGTSVCVNVKLEVRSSDLNNIFVTNPDTTGTTTGSGIGFKAYNGTSVAQSAGIILTSNTWSYGTYSANQLSVGSDGSGGIALRTANSAPISFFTGCTTAGLSAEKMRITSGGRVSINGATDDCVGTLWSCALSSTNNAARFRGCSLNYSVLDVCNFYAGGMGLYAEAGRHYFGGCVGIGTSTPTALLHVSGTPGQNNPSIRLTDSAATGNGGNVFISADKQGVGYNNLTTIAFSHTFKGGGSATNYLTIDSNGAACFASAVCAQQLIGISSATVNGPIYFQNGGNTYFQQYVGASCDFVVYNTTNNGYSIYTNSAQRFSIAGNGTTIVACDLCSKTLTTFGGGLNENFSATGGGHVSRYFAVKYMPENQTTAFFKITTSGASATQIHLAGTNAGVGWYSSQIYHAANSAYWGGWIGGGTEISKVGVSAGYITGVHSDGAGGQTYCVLVGNNGTGTSSLIWAYITTITFGGYSTSFTQL